MKSNTGTKYGIFLQKMLHFICVSGKNDNNIISMIFHFLNYGVNSFITVRAVSIIHKGIRFVNEQYAAFGFFEFFLNCRCSPAYIFSY